MSSVKIEVKREGLKRLGIVVGPVIVWLMCVAVVPFPAFIKEPTTIDWFMQTCVLDVLISGLLSLILIGVYCVVHWVYKGFVE